MGFEASGGAGPTVRIPCTLMRAGTSRGPFFLAADLPEDTAARDQILLSAMGSGHDLQIDGLGGGHPLTSKVAIVSRSQHSGADVDYLFAQVNVSARRVDTSPNCGNMLAGVGPFAIEKGLVTAQNGSTTVNIFNVNTGKIIEAVVQTPDGRVTFEGNCRVDGVSDPAAPIQLSFVDSAGSKTGSLFPTGRPIDRIDDVDVTCIDMATPLVIMRAHDLGKSATEEPSALDADRSFMERLEAIRVEAGRRMGLGDVRALVIPKPVIVGSPRHGGTISARYFMPHAAHRAFAVTGAVGLATAIATPGTIPHSYLLSGSDLDSICIEHPTGTIELALRHHADRAPVASVLRTVRKIFDGVVYARTKQATLAAKSLMSA